MRTIAPNKNACSRIGLLFFALLFYNSKLGAAQPDLYRHRKLRWAPEGHGLEGKFIVQIKTSSASPTTKNAGQPGGLKPDDLVAPSSSSADQILDRLELVHAKITRTFGTSASGAGAGFQGFAVSNLYHHADLEQLLQHEDVILVEQDQRVELYRGRVEQEEPPWGVDRLDQTNTDLDKRYAYEYTGKGVKIFVVDTGILSTHEDFAGRVTCGYNALSGTTCEDENGHGSHMAGTIAGTDKGVAKDAQLISVKIARDETGSGEHLLAGIEYIQGQKKENPSTPMVANLSLGLGEDGFSTTINDAVQKLVDQGVVVVVASGNHNADACNSSPASVSSAITVAASDRHDNFYDNSSYGSCVDLIAPGKLVFSNWRSSSTSTNTISGTSCAAAHVSGVAALLLEEDPSRSPHNVRSIILADALSGKVKGNLRDTPNLLLNTEALVSPPEPKCSPFLFIFGCECCDECLFGFICLR